MATRSEWVAHARNAIVELLTEHHAATQTEMEARLTRTSWNDTRPEIQPHIITLARKDLHHAGIICPTVNPTRGGSEIAQWRLDPIPRGKKRATEDAAARKRLLSARLHGWSRETTAMPNLIGKGGEAVIHNSLRQAAPFGYTLIQPVKGEVATLFGAPVPGGSLDNGAWLTVIDQQTQAPTGTFLVAVEVKNIRGWLYPTRHEVFQLLYKAACLAKEHPDHPVLPILICRRAHPKRTLQMAADLGFLVFQTFAQYVMPSERIDLEHFQEVCDELGMADLALTTDANPALVQWLSTTARTEARNYAERWASVGSGQADAYRTLREKRTPWPERVELMLQLHEHVREKAGAARNWAHEETDHDDIGEFWE